MVFKGVTIADHVPNTYYRQVICHSALCIHEQYEPVFVCGIQQGTFRPPCAGAFLRGVGFHSAYFVLYLAHH